MESPLLDYSNAGEGAEDGGASETDIIPNPPEAGLSRETVAQLRKRYGYNELAEKKRSKLMEFLSNFWGPMPIMIWIAIIIELIPKTKTLENGKTVNEPPDYSDFGVLLTLQLVNGIVSWYEHSKAADAVAALKTSLSPKAHVKRDGEWQTVQAREIVPGDLVSLSLGGAVPADCRVLGPKEIYCDQAALTGESLPVRVRVDDVAMMGSSITRGECDAVAVATGSMTFFGKTAKLIAETEDSGHFEMVLYKITAFLMAVSFVLTGIILGSLIGNGVAFVEALSVCVVLLVASIPIAMQVVCTSTMAIGSRKLAEHKAIVTRLASIEELAGMDMLCSDKTGTLTLGKMILQDILVFGNCSADDVLRDAALAAKWREPAKDAIDALVLGAVKERMDELNSYIQIDYEPFDPKTKRTESAVRRKGGSLVKVTKGAPQVVLSMCTPSTGIDGSVMDFAQIEAKIKDLASRGIRSLGVARQDVSSASTLLNSNSGKSSETGGWIFMGILTFLDPPRSDTKEVIERAINLGIDVKMITGDQVAIAKETSFQLGMGTNIQGTDLIPMAGTNPTDLSPEAVRFGEIVVEADGFAEVFPEHKYKIVETFRHLGYRCGMTGDGVNDAPALKRADIGIAVEGATDAARAAADIVLTETGLSVIIDAINISRKIFQRMKNYVTYRIACTIQLLLFFFIAVLFFHPSDFSTTLSHNPGCGKAHIIPNEDYDLSLEKKNGTTSSPSPYVPPPSHLPDYFKVPVIALVMITILNDGTIISIAYDRVVASNYPEKWFLKKVVLESLLLGLVACTSSILLLWLAMNSGAPYDPLYQWFGLHTLSYEEVLALLYLKISLSDFFTVFAARTRGFFFTRRPGAALFCAFVCATTASSLLAHFWDVIFTEMCGISWDYVCMVWLYCIVWFIIQDISKVLLNLMTDFLFKGEEHPNKAGQETNVKRERRRKLAKERMLRRGALTSPDLAPAAPSSKTLADLSAIGYSSMDQVLKRITAMEEELRELKAAVLGIRDTDSPRGSHSPGSSLTIAAERSLLSDRSQSFSRSQSRAEGDGDDEFSLETKTASFR